MFLVIGTTTVDLFVSGMDAMPRFDGDEFTSSSLVFCDQPLTMTLGGNGANSAYVLGTLGAPTALCSAAGQDDLGRLVASWLGEKGIDLRGFQRNGDARTPTTTAVVDGNLNRLSFHYPGPGPAYRFEDIPAVLFDEAYVLLITSYTLLSGFRPKGFQSVLRRAKRGGALTALDIGPLLGEPVTVSELQPMLEDVDYLLANERELAACTGKDGAQVLLDKGAKCVVVKQGERGAQIFTHDQRLHANGFPINARVTIGAGDSFNAGFLFSLQCGDDIQAAAHFGNATASLVVQSGKSVLGAPSVKQVEALVKTQR